MPWCEPRFVGDRCALLIRRDCLKQIGGLDEDFFLYYEDVDLCRRAAERGWKVCYEPTLHVAHHSPLHARRVPAPLRLMTRHALLTYGVKNWPRWQTIVLGGIIGVEATVRQCARLVARPQRTAISRGNPPPRRRRAVRPPRPGAECAFCRPPNNLKTSRPLRTGGYADGRLPHSILDRHSLAAASRFAAIVSRKHFSILRPPIPKSLSSTTVPPRPSFRWPRCAFRGATIRLPRSQGFCVAANRGIMAAARRHHRIAQRRHSSHSRLGGAGARLLQRSPHRRSGAVGSSRNAGRNRSADRQCRRRLRSRRLRLEERSSPTPDRRLPAGGPVAGASASSVFLRRSALERSGLFSERFGAYFEDVDLSLRCRPPVIASITSRRRGFGIAAAVRMAGRNGDWSNGNRATRNACFGGIWIAYRPWRALVRHLAVLGGKAVRRCREGTLLPFALGRLRAFSEIPCLASGKEDRSCPTLPPLGRS